MTVSELIEELSKIKNQSLEIATCKDGIAVPLNSVNVVTVKKFKGFKNEGLYTWVEIK